MKIFTLNTKGNLFPGASLPFRRTNNGHFYIKTPTGNGPAVSIDLLLSDDTKIISSDDHILDRQLLVQRASVAQREDGHYQLVKQASPYQNLAGALKQDQNDMALVWIPDIREIPTVSAGQSIRGTTIILEEFPEQKGKCHTLGTTALVLMKPRSSFLLTICQYENGRIISKDRHAEVTYIGHSDFLIDGKLNVNYELKWS
jgi:hypothetical protein